MAATSSSSCTTLCPQLSINRHKLQLGRRSTLFASPFPSPRPRLSLSIVMSGGDEPGAPITSSTDAKPLLNPVPPQELKNVYGSARIHDFCFGIPYGGIVLSGGLLGFIFTRNAANLGTAVLFGAALLALSTFSLKIWRQGKSSLPFVLGQAVLSAALFWRNFQAYSLTKKLSPAGFYVIISAAMLCFYLYVLISGGNPPPKKLQATDTVGTS